MIEGDNGEVLLALRSGIRRLVNGKTEAVRFPAGVKQVDPRVFLRDRNGALWIGTDAGLLHVHQGKTDVFTRADGLSGDIVEALFEDHEGNIWVTTSDGGLDRFRDFAVTTISAREGLSSSLVSSLFAARDGAVWIGTPDGLNRWKDGQITIYRKGSGGIPDDDVYGVFQDDRGRVWVFSLRGAGYLEDGRFVGVSGMPGCYTRAVVHDVAGSLWVAHDEGLFHLVDRRVAARIPWSSLGRKDYATSLIYDPVRGGLWLGFYGGGLAFFKDGEVRASYSAAGAGVSDGVGQGMVGGLQLDGDGTLWATTEGGLSRLKDGRIATLASRNGLPCDSVHWVIEDNDHSFWLSTSCGVARIERSELEASGNDPKRTVRVTVLDSSEGVVSPAFASRVTKATDGKIWFSILGGVNVIDPRHLPFNRLPPPVHIEQIKADGVIHDVNSYLRLPALSRDVEIDYTALSLVAPEKNRFRVKLEGWDRDWKDAGNQRKAFYGNLPPRSYRFRVMASNNSGVWNEAGDSFDFSIDPTYYQTRWFEAACAAAFLALLWGLYRYRLHQIAREFNMRLDERVGERTRLARDLHDTLLQGFQGLMLRLQAIGQSLPEGEIKDELERTLDRGDQVVAESRKAVHDLRLSTVLTNDLARAVKALGDELSSEYAVTFRLVVEGETRELHPIVRDEVYRITSEALRNAFSHARARHIEAEIIYAESLFRLRIRDDGEGIAPAVLEDGRPGHYGLAGMRERAAEIGAKLDIWSGAGTGTEIDLSIGGSIAYSKKTDRFREKGGMS
jgi:signal transduction histidine kinase/ligand-binding sensor domain-containing protein